MDRIRFGRFVLDRDQQFLFDDGEAVPLQPKVMRLLELLLTDAPAVVSRTDLLDQLWPDVIVSEANLKNLVCDLRRAIGDSEKNAPIIRTVHGRGYALAITPGREPAGPAGVLLVRAQGRSSILPAGDHMIGRQADCSIVLEHSTISRIHARLCIGDRVTLEDLGSKNGSFLDGVRLKGPIELQDDQRFSLGQVQLHIRRMGREDSTGSMSIQSLT